MNNKLNGTFISFYSRKLRCILRVSYTTSIIVVTTMLSWSRTNPRWVICTQLQPWNGIILNKEFSSWRWVQFQFPQILSRQRVVIHSEQVVGIECRVHFYRYGASLRALRALLSSSYSKYVSFKDSLSFWLAPLTLFERSGFEPLSEFAPESVGSSSRNLNRKLSFHTWARLFKHD